MVGGDERGGERRFFFVTVNRNALVVELLRPMHGVVMRHTFQDPVAHKVILARSLGLGAGVCVHFSGGRKERVVERRGGEYVY